MTKATSELLAELNAFRAVENEKPIAKWKKSRSDLEALLKTYDEEPETEADQEERLMEALTNATPMAETLNAAAELLPPPEIPAEKEAPSERVKSPRGAIGIMVMDLLQTDVPYKDIVAKVRETYWDAKTTERSIASVAMDLRRDGVEVPPRRKPAAPKSPKAIEPKQPATIESFEPSH